ncbi:MAG: hypothetical protein FD123_4127 [Bacteroidetes bacterium]|nr:MAG: hypothetical protein FD123_4127 [Bacteroidota bacterium]
MVSDTVNVPGPVNWIFAGFCCDETEGFGVIGPLKLQLQEMIVVLGAKDASVNDTLLICELVAQMVDGLQVKPAVSGQVERLIPM